MSIDTSFGGEKSCPDSTSVSVVKLLTSVIFSAKFKVLQTNKCISHSVMSIVRS